MEMKIRASKKTLMTSLGRIQGIVEKVSVKPITSNALIECTSEGVSVSANNLQIGMVAKYPDVEVLQKGTVSVNARKLFEIIKELPDQDITIEGKENFWIHISCGSDLNFKIIGLPPQDFPRFEKEDERAFVEWDIEKFISMINLTSFSISRDDTKQYINGAYCETIEGGETRIVTTDGFRLSIVDENIGDQITQEEGVIIPQKGINEIIKILNEKKYIKKFNICVSENLIIVKVEEIYLFVSLIEQKFPEYRVIIPGEGYNKREVALSLDILRPALKRMSIISSDKTRPVYFNVSENSLHLKAEDSETGSGEETIDLATPVEEEFLFCISCGYMLEVLNALEDDIVIEFNLEEEGRPIIVRPASRKENVRYIIMPMIMD